jgi:hypothetical protein
VVAGYSDDAVHRVFAKSQDASGISYSVAFGDTKNNFSYGLCGIFGPKKSGIPGFGKSLLANIALQQLSLSFSVNSASNDITLPPQTIMRTMFVNAKVTVDIEHVTP